MATEHRAAQPDALAAFAEVSASMLASLRLEDTLAAIARAAAAMVDAPLVVVLLDEGHGELVPRGWYGAWSEEWAKLRATQGVNATAWLTGQPVRVDDYRDLPPERRHPSPISEEEHIRSILAVPIGRDGRRLGAVAAIRRVVRPFDADEERRLELLAAQAGIAIDHARVHAELAQSRDRFEALLRATDFLWRPLPMADISQLVVGQAQVLFPGCGCLLSMIPRHQRELVELVAGSEDWAGAFVGRRVSVASTDAVERAVRTLQAVEVDGFDDRSALMFPELSPPAMGLSRVVPLTIGESLPDGRMCLGLITFYVAEPGRLFRDDERALMDWYARRVSLALHRAELLEQAQGMSARLEMALRATADISASLDPADVIRSVIMRATAAGRAERGVLLRIDGDHTVVEDWYDTTGGADIPGYRHPIASQPLMVRAIEQRAPILGGRYAVGHLDRALGRELGAVRHTATLPLVLDDRVEAVLVLSRRTDVPFGPDDVSLLQLVGDQAVLALRNARLFAQAKEVTRQQSDFINMAAHELRTPLSVMAGYLSMINEGTMGELPQHLRMPLETVHSKALELEALVSELLLASRLEGGRLPLQAQVGDLREVAAAAVERASARVDLLGGQLTVAMPDQPVPALLDLDHAGRVLDNLINNALTYCDGPPEVRVEIIGGEQPAIVVTDNGFGIPAAARDRIFERFYRVEDDQRRHVTGTGLGLYISRQLAERMGGSLTLDGSNSGQGASFRLRVPAA